MAKYVDGFLLSVKKELLPEYKKMALDAGKAWKRHGALDYKECMIEDATPQDVAYTFPKAAKTKEDEVTFFSFIVFKSRAHRDKVNKLVMKDPVMEKYHDMKMPFDMKRMAYGGFEVVVDPK